MQFFSLEPPLYAFSCPGVFFKLWARLHLTRISRLTFKPAPNLPKALHHWKSFFFKSGLTARFCDLSVFGSPFGPVSHHPDAPLPSFKPCRGFRGPNQRMSASLIGHHCQAPYFWSLLSSPRGSRFSTWSALRLRWPPQALAGSGWWASVCDIR